MIHKVIIIISTIASITIVLQKNMKNNSKTDKTPHISKKFFPVANKKVHEGGDGQ